MASIVGQEVIYLTCDGQTGASEPDQTRPRDPRYEPAEANPTGAIFAGNCALPAGIGIARTTSSPGPAPS